MPGEASVESKRACPSKMHDRHLAECASFIATISPTFVYPLKASYSLILVSPKLFLSYFKFQSWLIQRQNLVILQFVKVSPVERVSATDRNVYDNYDEQ